jgi:acyl carrier protein
MIHQPWAPQFESTLRQHAPLADDGEIAPDVILSSLGLDSLALVSLLLDMEEAFGITIPDDFLVAETFATAGSLWSAIAKLTDAQS